MDGFMLRATKWVCKEIGSAQQHVSVSVAWKRARLMHVRCGMDLL